MDWAVQIFKVFGIPVRIHVTFMVLLLAVTLFGKQMGVPATGQYYAMAMVCCMFGCVLIHELAHSLMARRFGVKVENITLLPIGGVASMTMMPRGPWQEFAIAVTGPIASLALAAALLVIHVIFKGAAPALERFNPFSGSLISNLFMVNLMLAVFNLIPAFPLDGGRALRGVLALFMGHEWASRFALKLGETFAALIFLLGVYYENWLLPFVALFIYIGADELLDVSTDHIQLRIIIQAGHLALQLVLDPEIIRI